VRLGDGVADLRVGHDLDAARDEADFAGPSDSIGIGFGENTPSDSTSWSCLVFISVTFVAFLIVPRARARRSTTPRYESYQESKISAFNGASDRRQAAARGAPPLRDSLDAAAVLAAREDGAVAIRAR
jgi:hypothetical protein